MKWFKHDTTATTDAKIRKLILRHGATGYAVYFHCIELIAGNVSENNVTFELEHDAEIIADDLKIMGDKDKSGREIVEEIMHTIIDLDLFEEDNGRIFCFKLLKRIDSSMTSSVKLRSLVEKAKTQNLELQGYTENKDKIMISHDTVMKSHARLDKTRQDKTIQDISKAKKSKKEFIPPTVDEVKSYCQEKGYNVDSRKFVEYYSSNNWKDKNDKPVKNWKLKLLCWNGNSQKSSGTSLISKSDVDKLPDDAIIDF